MSKWPLWLRVLVVLVAVGVVVGFSQLLLYFDRMGVGKFDL